MPTVSDLTAGAATKIGGYFSVVSALPSAMYAVLLYLLVHSGAWSGSPQWSEAVSDLTTIGIGGALGLSLLGIVLGLALHPLQFAFVQLLEGYWGASRPALRLRVHRVTVHDARRERLARLLEGVDDLADPVAAATVAQEATRLLESYPRDDADLMPTRLGNVLRKYERDSGRRYGLDASAGLSHLALVAPPEHLRYLNDQRTLLDLTVRFCVLSLLATATSVLFLWRHGLWLLLALVSYALAYLFYRGAVVVARQYGQAMVVLVDLNRFTLYERLHLPLPADTATERAANVRVSQLLNLVDRVSVRYRHPTGNP